MKQIQWNEAFDLFAKRVTEIQDKYGKESFAFLSTGQLATEEMALAGHIGRTFLGGKWRWKYKTLHGYISSCL